MSEINWFIGHMQKSLHMIKEQIKSVDLIIQVCDARSINVSTNFELISIANNKPIINLALKSDLADVKTIIKKDNLIIANVYDKKFTYLLKDKIEEILKPKILNLQKKGLVNPKFYLIVLGLPNVGKSSLINKLSNKKIMEVRNQPGVTRNVKLLKLSNNFFVYDTPGIMLRKVNTDIEWYILGTLGCISERVLPLYEIVNFNCDFYFKFYEAQIRKYFGFNEPYQIDAFLKYIANKYKFITSNNQVDYLRVNHFLFDLFAKGKICPINYDQK